MSSRVYFAVVVNGVETNRRVRFRDAAYKAYKLRRKHGNYAVWIRPHVELVAA